MTRSLHCLGLCLVLAGCSAITDFDRFGPGGGDGGLDAAMPADGGDCSDPVDELCNERDDDCDGNVDEDYNLQTDTDNCGECGTVCSSVMNGTPDCSGGDCVPDCSSGWGDCDGAYATGCETDLTDPDNCGECGTVCDSGTVCSASMGCVTTCPGSEEICGRSCIDTQTSTAHCGRCNNPCPTPAHSVAVCATGTCDYICDAGWDDCDMDPGNGCETDLTQVTDCGSCGNVCNYANGVPACDGTSCSLNGCQPGYEDCDSDPGNGCEADLASVDTCGSCTTQCMAPAHSSATCDGTACGFSCDMGWDDCDADPANGCEADLASDATCGNCSTTCSGGTPLCSGGTCVTGCMAPTPDRCGMTCTNLSTDPNNCGSCGMMCPDPPNASPVCDTSAGGCDFVCDVGFEDCNGMPGDGCEVNIRTTTDCGGCGVACAPPNGSGTCSTGTCQISSCTPGFDDCNGMPGDGCEENTSTNPMRCGSCTNVCSVANGTAGCASSMCIVAGCNPGFDDCNMMYTDGCEESLSDYFVDGDSDGYGDPTTRTAFCAAAVPAGWVNVGGDCNDADPNSFPMAPPLCEDPPADNDCDGDVDEGYQVGAPCECEPGSAPGTYRCSGTMSSDCAYPSEVCNGLDDDCDGNRDAPPLTCELGATMPCTTSCMSIGEQVCDSSCTWGACTPPSETCDFTDEDCDGDPDNGVLNRTTNRWSDTNPTDQMDVVFNPSANQIGVVYVSRPPSGNAEIHFARFTPSLGTFIGSMNLGGPGFNKANPHIEVTGAGEWFISYYTNTTRELYYTFMNATLVPSWRLVATDAQAYDVVSDPSGTRIWMVYVDTGVGDAFIRWADFSTGLGPRNSINGPSVPPTVADVALARTQTEFAVLFSDPSSNTAEWRRIDSTGTTRVSPINLMSAGYTYTKVKERSTYMDTIPGATFADDRIGVLFHARNGGGTNQFSLRVVDGGGTILSSTDVNRGTLTGALGMSAMESVMAYAQYDDVRRRDLSLSQLQTVAGGGYGSGSAIHVRPVGNFRYLVVGWSPTMSPNLEISGIGCVP